MGAGQGNEKVAVAIEQTNEVWDKKKRPKKILEEAAKFRQLGVINSRSGHHHQTIFLQKPGTSRMGMGEAQGKPEGEN